MEVDLVDAENVEWELHERGKAPDHVDVQRNLHHVVDLGGGGGPLSERLLPWELRRKHTRCCISTLSVIPPPPKSVVSPAWRV